MRIRFLGTGASGGTPGRGRSRRLESSALIAAARSRVLIDVGRDFERQQQEIGSRVDAVLLTHAHRDACAGLPALRPWLRQRDRPPVAVYASKATISALQRRFRRLDHCRLVPVAPGERRRIGGLAVTPLRVPHARERRLDTFAWRLSAASVTVVYASDVAALTAELRRFAAGGALLVIDAAMWGRSLFTHLTIDRELPRLCRWPVDRIALTQIGRTLPEHARLEREVRALCRKARPAYDGLVIDARRR